MVDLTTKMDELMIKHLFIHLLENQVGDPKVCCESLLLNRVFSSSLSCRMIIFIDS
jgi:hypothetical protein